MAVNVPSNKNIPASAAGVRDKMLRFGQGGPSVEEARQAMISAREPATTHKLGAKVPSFVEEEAIKKGIPLSTNTSATENAKLLAEAKNILAKYPLPAGKRYNLNAMRDQGLISQRHIDALLSEGAKPVEVRPTQEIIDSITEPEVAVIPERVPVAPVPPASAVEPEVIKAPESVSSRTVIEDDKNYTLYHGQEGRDWFIEIVYKNGAGTERWTANTQKDLIKQLAKAKAHASRKIAQLKEDNDELIVGDVPDNWDGFLADLKEAHGFTLDQFNALPEQSREAIRDSVEATHIVRFLETTPNYYQSATNYQRLTQYLASRDLPITYRNLTIAYRKLNRQDLLEQRPEHTQAQPVPVAAPVAVVPQVSAPESTNDHQVVVAEPVAAVPTAPTPAAPVPTVRKRVLTGLIPGSSSAAPVAVVEKPEEGITPQEPSEHELRTMSMSDLKRIATQNRKYARY